MKCTKCGQQVDPSDSFCGYCGTPAQAETSAGGIVSSAARRQATRRQATRQRASRRPHPAGLPPAEAFQQVVPPSAAAVPRPPMFRLAHDETVLKTYETVQLRTGLFKRKRGQGTLYVTERPAGLLTPG